MMKRLRSYGDDLGSAGGGNREVERPVSSFSSSSSHHRRFQKKSTLENGRDRLSATAATDSRDRDAPRGVRNRIDHDVDGFEDREGSRSIRKRINNDLGAFDPRDGSRGGLRKRIDYSDLTDTFDERDASRGVRKRLDHYVVDGFNRRKVFDRFRDKDGFDRGGASVSGLVSPRGGGYAMERDRERDRYKDKERDRIHRSESFCVSRGDLPRGFRPERECSKKEESIPSWRKFGSRSRRDGGGGGGGGSSGEDVKISLPERAVTCSIKGGGGLDGGNSSKGGGGLDGSNSSKGGGGLDGGSSSRDSLRSPHRLKDVKSPTWSKDSKDSAEPVKEVKKSESIVAESHCESRECGSAVGAGSSSASEVEEGELQPDSNKEPKAKHSNAETKAVENDIENKKASPSCPQNDAPNAIAKKEASSSCPQNDAPNAIENEKASPSCPQNDAPSMEETHTGQKMEMEENSSALETENCSPKSAEDLNITGGNMVEASELPDNSGKEPSVSPEAVICHATSNCLLDTISSTFTSTEIKESLDQDKRQQSGDGQVLSKDESDHSVPALETQEKELTENTCITKSCGTRTQDEEKNDTEVDVGVEEGSTHHLTTKVVKEDEKKHEPYAQSEKDKGKAMSLLLAADVECAGKSGLTERNFIAFQDNIVEGTSRGFELFRSSLGTKTESENRSSLMKSKKHVMKLEPLELSLGLPFVSLPDPCFNNVPPPLSSPPRARSVLSLATTLRTGSDGFTTSISFSGSQFDHNPSCSLTHNLIDYDCEQSVKSRPLFQGVDWESLAMNDSLPKELPRLQRASSNVNESLLQSTSSQGFFHSQALQGKFPALERSGSLQRHVSKKMGRVQDDVRSPVHSGGSHKTISDYVKDNQLAMAEASGRKQLKTGSLTDMEQVIARESGFVEKIVGLVVSQPVEAISWKFHDMADQSIICLKEGICQTILNEDNGVGKLRSFQAVLKTRFDLTLDVLLKSHRAQLEILVAIKTGMSVYLIGVDKASSSHLAEIFVGLKCRNINCQSALPVDDCDCRFCSKKDGFCSSCMCLSCSKFDTALNTCSWVGCDVCSHWCHMECGLKNSFIRNGHSSTALQGVSEMQFYCVACGHPSEMFGFVKDVFKTCGAEWQNETLLKELIYVSKIFSGSSDSRGILLHGLANKMAIRLQTGDNYVEAYDQIMKFLANYESKLGNLSLSSAGEHLKSLQQLEKKKVDGINCPALLVEEGGASWFRADKVNSILPAAEESSAGGKKSIWNYCDELQIVGKSNNITTPTLPPIMDELESIVKIKQAEAEMFQSKANNALRESESLRRIVRSKEEKIEEEFRAGMARLGLGDVKERRMRKMEEFGALQRSHREYMSMQKRMEDDIKELLLRMEDAKRNSNV